MANSDAPRGLVPVNGLGQSYCSRVNVYFKKADDTQPIFIGDAVTTTATAHTDEHSTPIVEQADLNNPLRGVCVGVLHDNPNNLTQIFSPASTGQYLLIADDPYQVFEIQEDSVGGALAATDSGSNTELVIANGSTVTGLSGMEADSTVTGTGTAQLRLLRISPRIGNALGTNANWLVMLNEHELKSTTGL